MGLLAGTALLCGCSGGGLKPIVRLRLAGAQIPVELVQSWLHDAETAHFETQTVAPVYLSQHGFEHLARGECDLACTDRVLSANELPQFAGRSVAGRRLGFYGYALYVHPQNPLDNIFAGHIRLVFRQRIVDWKELGGSAGPIRLIGPLKSTRGGTILMQQANVWFANPTWEALEADSQVIAAVAADPSALGFASIGYDRGVRYLGIRSERTAAPAFPSLEEIEADRYPLAKVIYVYAPDPPAPPAAAAIDYLLGPAGHAAMESTQVWPIDAARSRVAPPS